jgi:hypothetical protein
MAKKRLSWTPVGPLERMVWSAPTSEGAYEVDHWSYLARFVRASPAPAIERFRHRFGSLEAAQAYCEEHWRLLGGDDDSSSRLTPVHQVR